MPKITYNGGIYRWRNLLNEKVYIGSTKEFKKRLRYYQRCLPSGNCHNSHLQSSWNKYGGTNFVFEVIEKCAPEQLIEREQYWIDTCHAADNRFGYNQNPKAGCPSGLMTVQEIRDKISAALKGRVMGEEWRRRIGLASANRSQATKDKIAASLRGTKASEETKAKLSEAQKLVWQRPGHRERVSSTGTGKKKSPETRARMKASQIKRAQDPVLRKALTERLAKGRAIVRANREKLMLTVLKTPYQRFVEMWGNGCGSEHCQRARNICLARGDVPCDILCVGEAPGLSEDVVGTCFIGPAGRLLDEIIAKAIAGTNLKVGFCNLTGCIPLDTDSRKAGAPDDEQIKCCATRLVEFITYVAKPRLLVRVGKEARDYLTPGWRHSIPIPAIPAVDIVHPAAILRAPVAGRSLMCQRSEMAIADAAARLAAR